MHAVTIVDGKLEWREHPDPVPGLGQVLVRVRAAGLNSGDRLQVKGFYPAPPGSPADIPGLELAGEVVALGPGAERFAIGDRVMAVVGGGGQGEMCTVHERHLLAVPDHVTWAEAGGYDKTIVFYGEDPDVAVRLAKIGKVKWTFRLKMKTSGRRLKKEGVFRTGMDYALNFFWVTFRGKPATKDYEDIRSD